ncbi:MAG: pyrroloquinoline quinone-dependent dehydrogenase [Acidobacteriota bacterium]
MIQTRALCSIGILLGCCGMGTLALHAQGVTSQQLLEGLANPTRWLTYSGDYSGRRHSPLTEITPGNAARLAAQWTFQTGVAGKFETTPIVIDGVLYATGPQNHAWAIDGRTGRQIWRYQRPVPQDVRACCGLVNRGFGVLGDRLYLATLDAHLVALDMKTGKVVWDVEIADYRQGYASTPAPLIVDDKVIVGIAGGEFAIRGFLDAYDAKTGARVWRFWTIPAPGEPGSETWPTDSWERGGAPTWLSGSYDPDARTLYWGTGNPNPDFFGDDRKGDNLYSGSLIALDADSGKLKWHFQFTPHDTHDWDANQIPVLAELAIGGQPRKVVMVANRNGFLYVLDRVTGRFIHAHPFVHQTWAKEIGPDGRPIELPDQRPTPKGTLTCPDLFGGTNFMSPSFDPATGLLYVSARETCQIFISEAPPAGYKAGDRTMGGRVMRAPDPPHGALRAIDPLTGERKWEIKHPAPSWAGVLSTAGGVVFSGTNEGEVFAADSRTGKELWRYQMGAPVYAPPTTYQIDGRQFVVMPAGMTLTAFALPKG